MQDIKLVRVIVLAPVLLTALWFSRSSQLYLPGFSSAAGSGDAKATFINGDATYELTYVAAVSGIGRYNEVHEGEWTSALDWFPYLRGDALTTYFCQQHFGALNYDDAAACARDFEGLGDVAYTNDAQLVLSWAWPLLVVSIFAFGITTSVVGNPQHQIIKRALAAVPSILAIVGIALYLTGLSAAMFKPRDAHLVLGIMASILAGADILIILFPNVMLSDKANDFFAKGGYAGPV